MGSTVSLPTSFSTTIGMLVTGSIIKPRIFISTSIHALLLDQFAQKTVWKTPGNEHVNITAHGGNCTFRAGKVQGNVLRGTPNHLGPGLVFSFNHYFIDLADASFIVGSLYLALPLLQNLKTLRFLLVGDAVNHAKGRRVGPGRILEAENAIELAFVQQGNCLFEFRGGFPGKSDNNIRG